MGFLDFLNKIKKKSNKKKEVEKEKVYLENLETFLDSKKKENNDKESEIMKLINEKTEGFVTNIVEQRKILETIDVNEKKAEERFKVIVKENLNNYIKYLKDVIEKIEKLEKRNPQKTISEIDKIFLNFNKNSSITYEKATILIGKEMAVTKKTIKDFSNYLIQVSKENKSTIESSKVLYFIEKLLEEINGFDKNIQNFERKINNMNEEIKENKENLRQVNVEINTLHQSDGYMENQKRKKEIIREKEVLNMDILSFKDKIDFKAIRSFYHSYKNDMKKINKLKEDFSKEVLKNEGNELLKIIEESKILDKEKIEKELKNFLSRKKVIEEEESLIEKDETIELQEKINKLNSKIIALEEEKEKLLKKKNKFVDKKKDLIEELKIKLKNINAKLDLRKEEYSNNKI